MVKITSSEQSKKASSRQKGERKPWYKKWWGITIIIITVVIIIPIIMPSSNEKDSTSPQSQEAQVNPASYEIVWTKDISTMYGGEKAKRMNYGVVVGKDIERKQIRPTVEKIVSNLTKNNNEIDSIHLLLYSTKDRVDGFYDIAMADWAPGGEVGNLTGEIVRENIRKDYKISIEIKDNLEEYLQKISKEETKFGLMQQERKQIFNEIVKCEDKAMIEAEKYYSSFCSNCPEFIEEDLNKETDMEKKITKSCEEKMRAKYDITEEQQSEISLEGIEKSWPFPEPLPDPECCGY